MLNRLSMFHQAADPWASEAREDGALDSQHATKTRRTGIVRLSQTQCHHGASHLMKHLLVLAVGAVAASSSMSATYCNGMVNAVYKWNGMTSLSIQVRTSDGTTTNWINMPTRSDEAMALVALTAGKPITLYWNASDVTTCANGWAHNRSLDGFMVVGN